MRYMASLQLSKISKTLALICCGIMANDSLFAQAKEEVDTVGKAMDEVVVTGQYQAQSLRKSVYKINVIDQKRIQAKAATNAQQILSGELGVRFSNDMALGAADISMMGMAGRNIKILLDGVPMLDRNEIRESLNQISASQIERIELIEGPMSTMYGSDALAGIINIITKRPEEGRIQINAQIVEETAAKEYDFGIGDGLHTQSLGLSWDKEKFNLMASILHYDFGGFGSDSLNRNHKWMPKEQLLPSIRFGYRDNNWDFLYRNDYLLETITSKSAINTDNYRATNKFFTTKRMAQQMQFNRKWNNKWFLNSSLGFTNYRRDTKTDLLDYVNRTITLSTAERAQDVAKFQSLNFRTSLLYIASKKLNFQPGIEISYDNAIDDRIKGSPEISNYAVFLTAEYKPTEEINIRPGIRYNKNSLYDAPVISSLNLLYRLNDNVSIRGSYAQGFRAPALRELYFDFVDANHAIYGNDKLKAERSQSFNVSFSYRKPLSENKMYSTEVSYFYNTFDNFIDYATIIDTLSGLPPDTNRRITTLVNINNYKTTGVSFINRFLTKHVEWRLGGMMLGQYNRSSEVTSDVKEFAWAPELTFEMMYQVLSTKTKFNLFYKYTGKRNAFNASYDSKGDIIVTMGTRSAYTTVDFNIQQQIVPQLNFVIGARNLLNVTDINNTATVGGVHSSGGNIPFSYGRSYFASLSYVFNNHFKK